MNDIGSIFPLYQDDINVSEHFDTDYDNYKTETQYFALGREAILALLQTFFDKPGCVLLPAFTCETVIDPFLQEGWRCVFYDIDANLQIVTEAFDNLREQHVPDLVLFHPYFGRRLSAEECGSLRNARDAGSKVVLDMTQCIFSDWQYPFVDYYVGSWRKWLAIPDGGFLFAVHDKMPDFSYLNTFEKYVSLRTDSMYLRGSFFSSGDEMVKTISRKMDKEAEQMIEKGIALHKMSARSRTLLMRANRFDIQKRRTENFRFLEKKLSGAKAYSLPIHSEELDSAPLYFPILTNSREKVQNNLIRQRIYAPILWPVVEDVVLVSETVRMLYSSLLAIPCDQRYSYEDLQRIVDMLIELND